MFISSNGEDDEYGIEKVVTESMRVAQAKMKVATKILEEEISVNPQSTSYIINNSKRYQNILVFQDFLKTQIQKDILDTNNLKQASFFRLRTYLVFIGFYYSIFLCGDTETSTPLYFGKLDSEGRFESLSPTYSLIDLGGGKTHLKVFLDNQSLFLYNYSLSENSLGIKLECKSKGVPLILESDLSNSTITGCPNPPLSGGPCTKIALIPPLALSFYTREFLS